VPYAIANDVRIYYEVHGDGPALVLCHGSGGHHAIWWQQIPHFRDRYQVIALDFPGFGNSDSDSDSEPETRDAHSYPDAIVAVLDDAEVDRAILVGQSLGCAPSLCVAVRHPERVAAVVMAHSTGGIADDELERQVRADRAEADKLPVLDRLLSRDFQREEPAKVVLFREMGTFNRATAHTLRNSRAWPTTLADVKGAIEAGVFVCFLQGTADAVVRPASYEVLRRRLPQAHVESVEGAPHSLYWEAPDLFNAAVDRILARIPAGRV
jgi:pimeloyl-ACP methyl ester carboxylesterase